MPAFFKHREHCAKIQKHIGINALHLQKSSGTPIVICFLFSDGRATSVILMEVLSIGSCPFIASNNASASSTVLPKVPI